jgi:hypothetical protein
MNPATSSTDSLALEIQLALDRLHKDEWALTKVRETYSNSLSPAEAFESVVKVAELALLQTDQYAFLTCCWLVRDLAKRSDTAQAPSGLGSILTKLALTAKQFDVSGELKPIYTWYRLPLASLSSQS